MVNTPYWNGPKGCCKHWCFRPIFKQMLQWFDEKDWSQHCFTSASSGTHEVCPATWGTHSGISSSARHVCAAFFKCKATWNKVILPKNDLPLKFWTAQQGHPQWEGHPLSTMNPNQLKKMIPLSLHGDEVPITGIGKQWSRKMVNFSWHSLLSTIASVRDSQFFIWALFEKVGLNEEEVGGYNTLWHFFKVLAWSFEFLFKGIYPTHDVNGKEQLGSNGEGITKQASCFFCNNVGNGMYIEGDCWETLLYL